MQMRVGEWLWQADDQRAGLQQGALWPRSWEHAPSSALGSLSEDGGDVTQYKGIIICSSVIKAAYNQSR